MKTLIPKKLGEGSTLRVFAPARSLAIIDSDTRKYADLYFKNKLKIKLSFSDNVDKVDTNNSPSAKDRIIDLNAGFKNSDINGLITVIGGYNSNQLLGSMDWELIINNPKILCGFSDITALQNAIFAKTGLITYSGPHYINFGQKYFDEYTADYFKKCLFSVEPYEIFPSKQWTDDKWFLDQDNRVPVLNTGFWNIQNGEAEGTIIGGNLCTLNLLQGTEYMPLPDNIILFIEDDEETYAELFDRDLQSLLHCLGNRVRGIAIGRFQKESEMTKEKITQIITSKSELNDVPVIANVDFGHTDPKITFPIGGKASLKVKDKEITLVVIEH